MKIGIDARMLGPGFGLARYVQQLVLHLQEVDHKNQYVLFMREKNWDRFEPTRNNFKKVLADIPWYTLEEQLKFKSIIKKQGVDLMHFPHWNIPLIYNDPYVVTIHDLIMFHYPRAGATTLGPIKFWLKDKAHRQVIRHAVKAANSIIATSDFTRQDIEKHLTIPKGKIRVVYQAPFTTQDLGFSVGKEEVLNKYNIDKPYLLYVGSAYPHKNLLGLLEAWKIFRANNNYQLVLVGRRDYFYERVIKKVKEEGIGDVIFTGFVEDDELSVLYTNAYLYVFPSLYEGFGLPPLEAMSYGVPVISSNRSCLPEVLGDSVLYFDPENFEHMAVTMDKALNEKNIQMELQQNAREHFKKFSWERLAKETKHIYGSCLNKEFED